MGNWKIENTFSLVNRVQIKMAPSGHYFLNFPCQRSSLSIKLSVVSERNKVLLL